MMIISGFPLPEGMLLAYDMHWNLAKLLSRSPRRTNLRVFLGQQLSSRVSVNLNARGKVAWIVHGSLPPFVTAPNTIYKAPARAHMISTIIHYWYFALVSQSHYLDLSFDMAPGLHLDTADTDIVMSTEIAAGKNKDVAPRLYENVDEAELQKKSERYLFNYGTTFLRDVICGAKGLYVYTASGKKILDWTSGNALS